MSEQLSPPHTLRSKAASMWRSFRGLDSSPQDERRELNGTKIVGVPDALQPSYIEPFFVGLLSESGAGETPETAAHLDDEILSYMKSHGVETDPDSPDFNKDLYDTVYFFADKMAKIKKDQWYEEDIGTGETFHEKYNERLRVLYEQPKLRAMEDHGESVDSLTEATDQCARRLAEALAKRSRDVLFTDKKSIESAKEELSDMIRAMATELYLAEEGMRPHDELVDEIDGFIESQITVVASHLAEVRIEKAASRNRVVNYIAKKWVSWGPQDLSGDHKLFSKETWSQLFSRENLKGNLKKSAAMMGAAAVGAAVTAPVLAMAGATGGIVAGAAVSGAWLTNRVAKGLASQKLTAMGREEQLAEAQRVEMNRLFISQGDNDDDDARRERLHYIEQEMSARIAAGKDTAKLEAEKSQLSADLQSQLHDRLLGTMTERVDSVWRRNRNRMIGGIGLSLVVGGAAAGAAHFIEQADFMQSFRKTVGDVADKAQELSRKGNGAIESGNGQTPPTAPPPAGDARAELPLVPGNSPESFDSEAYLAQHSAALTVTKGEGWYQTFKELGIKAEYRDDLLAKIGPQLVRDGVAYEKAGQFFISRPGMLNHAELASIVTEARNNGWLESATQATGSSEALAAIHRGEGVLESLRDAGVTNANMQDVANVGPALEQAGVGYHAPELGGTGLYYHDGAMPQAGQEILRDYADNHLLDHSADMKRAATVNADSFNASVKEFAAEHGLSGDVDTVNELVAQTSANGNLSGLAQVVEAGDTNHSGTIADEVQRYVDTVLVRHQSFEDALAKADNGFDFVALTKYQPVIDSVGPQLAELTYAGDEAVPVAVYNVRTGHYDLTHAAQRLPAKAKELLLQAGRKTDYRLAS